MPTFIILEGILHESGAFELRRGFEDTRFETAGRFERGDGAVAVSLLDGNGAVLHEVTPPVRFPTGCTPGASGAGRAFIRAGLARHDDARRIELRVGARVAFSAEVAPAPPAVQASIGSRKEDALEVVVKRDGDADVRVLARLRDGRRVAPRVSTRGDAHAVDLASLEGLGEADILVEATRGFRTTRVVAATVTPPDATILGHIIAPGPAEQWPWGRRGSLIGNLSDRNGRRIDWTSAQVVWRIDGQPLQAGTPIVAWRPPDAGSYRIELVRRTENGDMVLDERTLAVNPQTAEQKEWVAAWHALQHRRQGGEQRISGGAAPTG